MASLNLLDWAIFLGYLAVVFFLGLWFARGQHSNEDYFVGGRKMNWLAIGLSLFAGTFSSLSFVGLPRDAAYDDYHLYLSILFIPLVVTPIVWWMFIPLYHRRGLISAYEYLERRFNRGVRLLASVLNGFYTIGWMGSLLLAVGVLLQAVLGLTDAGLAWTLVAVGLFATLYTTLGGVKAVVWTDVLQAVALGGGMLAVLLLGVARIDGGWPELFRVAGEHGKLRMFNTQFTSFVDPQGTVFAACAFGFFVYLAGHAVSFTAVQRYVSMPSVAAARRSLIVNGVMVAVVCLVFFLVGTMIFVYYQQHAPVDADPANGLPKLEKSDQLMPLFVVGVIPGYGLTGLLLAGLFAAAMSSIDSGINSLTASVVCDWFPHRKLSLNVSRILCAGFGFTAVAVALMLQHWGKNVFHIIMTIAGTFLGLLLSVFLLGILCRRASASAAVAGLAAGAASLLAAMIAAHQLTGHELSHWWYGLTTCLPALAVGWLWSLAMPVKDSLASTPTE